MFLRTTFVLYSYTRLNFRDPVQLNLLYEQAKEQILNGTHPVEIEKAITFAAYQVEKIFHTLHYIENQEHA